MAAIIIRTRESKTPGEDFALEERKGRWGGGLPCPLPIKPFRAAGSRASPDCTKEAMEHVTEASPFLPPSLNVVRRPENLFLVNSLEGIKARPLPSTLVKTRYLCSYLVCAFKYEKCDGAMFPGGTNLYACKEYDLERDLLNPNLYGLWILKSLAQKRCQESRYYKDASRREKWVNCQLSPVR